jgi:hypothetical protein
MLVTGRSDAALTLSQGSFHPFASPNTGGFQFHQFLLETAGACPQHSAH